MSRGREKFKKFKPIINLFVYLLFKIPFRLRLKLFEYSRMIKGTKGLVIRYVLLKTVTEKCGDNVSIHPNVFLLNPHKLKLGNNVSIHPLCYIESLGEIEIGDDVSIAHGVTIMSTGHNFDRLDTQINNQGSFCEKVVIENNVWIGAKATILSGNRVNTGSVIAASAVVTKDVSKNSIVGGIPARLIKERN